MEEHEVIFEEYLRSKGLLLTSQRKIIMDYVFLTHEHFDADTLLFEIQKNYREVSRATVYRTLPLMINAGLIKKSEKIKDKDCYEHIIGHPRHIHLVCLNCHKIFEVEESRELSDLIRVISDQQNISVKDYTISVQGICNECKKN
jgi:Fur family ferric uptake transcriptional regulator